MNSTQYGIKADLYKAGVTEDGEDYIAEFYVIVAQRPGGSREEYNRSFPGCIKSYSEDGEGPFFEDVREQALAKAERVLRGILENGRASAGGVWHEVDPEYGSPAYQSDVFSILERELDEG